VSEREDEMIDDGLIERAARELRRPVRLDPALDARVMEEIGCRVPGVGGRVRAAGARRAWRWLVEPRSVRLSPLAGLAAAAVIVVGAVVAGRGGLRVDGAAGGSQVTAVATGASSSRHQIPDTRHPVQFVLLAPAARTVAIVGDFNDWQVGSTPLRATAAGGAWTVEVPLAPGRHRYAFVVDGARWMPDPAAPTAPGDDFGMPSSVVTVVERRT